MQLFNLGDMEFSEGINYLILEGIDGVGKSSLVGDIASELRGKGYEVHIQVEPDLDTTEWVQWQDAYRGSLGLDGESLFLARRHLQAFGLGIRVNRHLMDITQFDLSKVNVVIKDRSFISGLVYQYVGLDELFWYLGIYSKIYMDKVSRMYIYWVNEGIDIVRDNLVHRDNIEWSEELEKDFLRLRGLYLACMVGLDDMGVGVYLKRDLEEVKRELSLI